MTMGSGLNPYDLYSLLSAAQANPSSGMMMENSHVLNGFTNSAASMGSGSGLGGNMPNNGGNTALLRALLLQQQAEEDQKRVLLVQQLANLRTGPTDNLALLIQQQRQLQALQSLNAGMSPAGSMGLLSGVGLNNQNPLDLAAASLTGQGSSNQLDNMALAKILQHQQQATLALSQNGLVNASSALMQLGANAGLSIAPERKRKGRTGTFPQKLHQMLQDLERQEGGTDIASFLPHGRAFSIHKPRDFVKHVMPKYFRMSRFSSFQRQLNLYDFQRITEGPDKGAYFHDLFVQGRPMMSTMMKRNKIKGVKLQKKGDAEAEEEEEEADQDEAQEDEAE